MSKTTNMKYELAKKLKEAGFPYSDMAKRAMGETGDMCAPMLDELIAACGEGFHSLRSPVKEVDLMRLLDAPDFWFAMGWDTRNKAIGDTPEEAVARLWLALSRSNSHNKEL